MKKHRTHPTAEEVYLNLSKEIPTLSKTSVYNTLSLFVEKGLVQMLTIEENIARFDADTSVHGHFQCKVCGKIYDFLVEKEPIQSYLDKNFEVEKFMSTIRVYALIVKIKVYLNFMGG